MHEWLSGGASPCQGEGRGFESRLVLFLLLKSLAFARDFGFFIFQSECEEGNIVHRCGILLFAFKCDKKREIIKLFSENYDIIRQKEFRDKGKNYL